MNIEHLRALPRHFVENIEKIFWTKAVEFGIMPAG
jgi:hypothetical protein